MDIKQRIEIAKTGLKKAEQAKTVAETQKASAEAQRDEVVEKMAAESVTPETIDQVIAQEEAANLEALEKIETLIPQV